MTDVVALPVGAFRAQLGEGPVWDDRRCCLWFVDIDRRSVHCLDPATGEFRSWPVGQEAGALALTAGSDLVLAMRDGFYRFSPETGVVRLIVHVEQDVPHHRMNDGAVDRRGRFWAGTLSEPRRPEAALYRLDPDGRVSRHLEGVTISNGIDWSPDDRLMYYVDTPTGRVDVFDFDLETGTIAGRRTFVEVPAAVGSPDGLVVDADGGIWVALWGGAAVRHYAPDGRLVSQVSVSATNATKPVFGGRDLRDLYVTSAVGSGEAGAVFHVRLPVRGRLVHRFAG